MLRVRGVKYLVQFLCIPYFFSAIMIFLHKYRLELHWDSMIRVSGSLIILKGPRFTGPALAEAAKINSNDSIRLDVSEQIYSFMGAWGVISLNWGEVLKRVPGSIYFDEASLHSSMFKLPTYIDESGFLVIDTSKHEEEIHAFNMNYDAFFVDSFGKRV